MKKGFLLIILLTSVVFFVSFTENRKAAYLAKEKVSISSGPGRRNSNTTPAQSPACMPYVSSAYLNSTKHDFATRLTQFLAHCKVCKATLQKILLFYYFSGKDDFSTLPLFNPTLHP